MARSSLTGTESAPTVAPGRDTASLGPSDTSDSGSDLTGVDLQEDEEELAADQALSPDVENPGTVAESMRAGLGTDAAGTGERRGAGGDDEPEAPDLDFDQIVQATPEGGETTIDDALKGQLESEQELGERLPGEPGADEPANAEGLLHPGREPAGARLGRCTGHLSSGLGQDVAQHLRLQRLDQVRVEAGR
jgi:hypothetical protein